ncbi:MAG: enolase C-terminal domain-like protein [Verrucomicrobiota bacterium]
MHAPLTRRRFAGLTAASLAGFALPAFAAAPKPAARDLRIKRLKVTPIALPDPPILAASGCHGPYFLRTIVELETDDGITGIGETQGDERVVQELEQCRKLVEGRSAFAYRSFAAPMRDLRTSVYAGIEMACLDAVGRATGRRVCELLGGPVREEVEFAAYLFYRYAADDPRVFADTHLVDRRGKGDQALDRWGEVRTPEAMAEMAWQFHQRWGFRVMKLKAGVLEPEVELRTLQLMNERFGGKAPLRIDPNGRWSVNTAIRIGRELDELPLEYYEDPVQGLRAMADVRHQTGLRLATNSCVTRWHHLLDALAVKPIDVLLADLYWFGGIAGVQSLGVAAENVGWGLSYHSNNHAGVTMAAMIHTGAITPQLTYAGDTHYVWLADGADIIQGSNLPIRGGKMKVPAAPGLGVQLDPDKLARAHETWRKSGMRRRDDATTMRRFEPGWKPTLL